MTLTELNAAIKSLKICLRSIDKYLKVCIDMCTERHQGNHQDVYYGRWHEIDQ
jgi:hypothetical protein